MNKQDAAFLRQPIGPDEAAAIHVETDGFDPATARLKRIAAVRVAGDRILTGRGCVVDCEPAPAPERVASLLRLIGARPLLGFFVDFSGAMLDRLAQTIVGEPLRNQRVEVSGLYYDYKPKTPGKNVVNLRLAAILEDLRLPPRPSSGALDTATATALIWLRLRGRTGA